MAEPKFSMEKAIRFGWSTMKNNIGFFLGFLAVMGFISFGLNYAEEATKENTPALSAIISIITLIFQMVAGMGLINVTLRFCDHKKVEFENIFSCLPLFFKYLGGSILYGLITLGGTILLIVPGIIWAVKFQFFSYLIIDQGLGPIAALKKSARITQGAKLNLFAFGLLLAGINFLGIMCLLVGLFATIPTTSVAVAFVYRKLLSEIESVQTPQPPAL